jgi:hypothetical protein
MANIIDLLEDNYFMDNSNLGIARDFYKRQGFQDTMSYLLQTQSSLYSKEFVDESIILLDSIIDNENILITQSNNIRYNDIPYIINEYETITNIQNRINLGLKVLVYCSKPINNQIYYNVKFI